MYDLQQTVQFSTINISPPAGVSFSPGLLQTHNVAEGNPDLLDSPASIWPVLELQVCATMTVLCGAGGQTQVSIYAKKAT